MQARSSRPVLSWLDRDPAFRQLARQLDDLVALQRVLHKASGGAPVIVSGLADGTLTVVVPGAAWASRLRQVEPSLVAALAREGVRVQRLKIRPRRQAEAVAPPPAPKKPPPPEALAALAALRAEADAPALQQALARMLARHEAGSKLRPAAARR